jgi:twitching motility protein PilT
MFTQEPDSSLVALATATVECGASDLHLTVGRPATVRRDGTLVAFENVPDLTEAEIVRIIMSLIDDDQKQELDKNLQLDFSFGLSGVGRFRANAFNQRGTLALALRVVPFRVRSLEELGAPSACTTLLNRPYGIVLVVGPTGSGKSTTLAAMIDRINETKPLHILTIEDPVEYLHQHKMAMVNQREVGTDVRSFEHGLKSALREDPDVVLLGEMRDLESPTTPPKRSTASSTCSRPNAATRSRSCSPVRFRALFLSGSFLPSAAAELRDMRSCSPTKLFVTSCARASRVRFET